MANIPNTRMLKLLEVIHMLHRRPCSYRDLTELTGNHIRTVYRYLTIIESLGIEVTGRKKGMMTIKNCPICG